VGMQLDVYYGIHPEIQELTICVAASVASWALDQGLAVGLYANTTMYMPEVGMTLPNTQSESAENAANVESIVADQLKRRRIHLPPSSNEEQRRRLLETLARIQAYFGSPIEDLVRAERSRLPAGATVVMVTSAISDPLLDALARVQQSGHVVTILFVGDSAIAPKLAGVTIYHLGGEETWKQLMRGYMTPTDETPEKSVVPASFRL
jgi:hypothetical protein